MWIGFGCVDGSTEGGILLVLVEDHRFEPVWKGKKPNRTEPKLIGLNRFSVWFGSKKNLKFFSIWLFILVQNRTEPEMLSPSYFLNYPKV